MAVYTFEQGRSMYTVAVWHATVSCRGRRSHAWDPIQTLPLTPHGRRAHLLGLCHGARLVLLAGLRLLGRAGARGRLALRPARCGRLVLIRAHALLGYEATSIPHLAGGLHTSHTAATLHTCLQGLA